MPPLCVTFLRQLRPNRTNLCCATLGVAKTHTMAVRSSSLSFVTTERGLVNMLRKMLIFVSICLSARSVPTMRTDESRTSHRLVGAQRPFRADTFPRFASATVETRESASSAKGAPPPLTCCQICPQKFFLDLELMEYREPVKERVYETFHHWHRSVRALGGDVSDADAIDEIAFLEFQSERRSAKAGKSGSPPIAPPPSIDTLGIGPCCSLCPDLFYPRPTPEPGAKAGEQGVIVFVEQNEHVSGNGRGISKAQERRSLGDDKLNAFLETGTGTSSKSDFMPHIDHVSSSPCCQVCPAQFFMPRSYGDVMNRDPPTSSGGVGKGGKAGETCCKTCPQRMMETAMMAVAGDDVDAPTRLSHADETAQRNAMQLSLPRNPSNKRAYGDESKSGAK